MFSAGKTCKIVFSKDDLGISVERLEVGRGGNWRQSQAVGYRPSKIRPQLQQ